MRHRAEQLLSQNRGGDGLRNNLTACFPHHSQMISICFGMLIIMTQRTAIGYPDRVLFSELKLSDIHERSERRAHDTEYRCPGSVPGCVVDAKYPVTGTDIADPAQSVFGCDHRAERDTKMRLVCDNGSRLQPHQRPARVGGVQSQGGVGGDVNAAVPRLGEPVAAAVQDRPGPPRAPVGDVPRPDVPHVPAGHHDHQRKDIVPAGLPLAQPEQGRYRFSNSGVVKEQELPLRADHRGGFRLVRARFQRWVSQPQVQVARVTTAQELRFGPRLQPRPGQPAPGDVGVEGEGQLGDDRPGSGSAAHPRHGGFLGQGGEPLECLRRDV
jgi:hypothetical protein